MGGMRGYAVKSETGVAGCDGRVGARYDDIRFERKRASLL